MKRTVNDLKWGLGWGIAMALVYSGIAASLNADVGAPQSEVLAIAVVYFLAGIGSGALLGLLRRRITTQVRAALLGIVIAFPGSMIMAVADAPNPFTVGTDEIVVALIGAAFFGSALGWFFGPGGPVTRFDSERGGNNA